jgi:hypothetical protein
MEDQFLINIDPYLPDLINFYEAVIFGVLIGLVVSMLLLWICSGRGYQTGNKNLI